MSIRRLARQAAGTSGLLIDNWTVQATETYVPATPAVAPVSWGTDPEIAALDRDFDATGSLKTHLGYLATVIDKPDAFWGAVVKLQITYSVGENPQLEMWTHDAPNGWAKRRKLDVRSLARSGDTTIYDLILAAPLTGVDMVWITLAPTATETNTWVCAHLYGDCDLAITIPDCPAFSDPPDCSLSWPTDFPTWMPDPDPIDPIPGIPDDPPGPPPPAFPFPPIIVEVFMPTTYIHNGPGGPNAGKWFHACPGPTQIKMFFDIRHPGAAVRVTVLDAIGVLFNEGVSQTITGSGTMTWSVMTGFTLDPPQNARGPKFLPPRQLKEKLTFLFQPLGDFSVLDLLDWEQFLWTYSLAYIELC